MPSAKTIDRIRQLQEWKKQRAKKEVDKINRRNTPRKDILRKQKEAVASPTMRSLKLYSKIGEDADEPIDKPKRRKSSNLKRKSLKLGQTPKRALLTSEKKKMSSPFALRPSQSSNTPTRLRVGKKSNVQKPLNTRSHERTKSKENEAIKLTGVSKNTANRRRRRSRRGRKRRNSEKMKVKEQGRRRSVSLQDSVQSFRDEEEVVMLRATPMRQQDKILSPSQPESRDLNKTTPSVQTSLSRKTRLNTPISRERDDSATSPEHFYENLPQSSVKAVQDKPLSREIPQSQIRVEKNPEFSDALEADSPTSKISESKVSDVMSADSKVKSQDVSEKVHVESSVWGGLLSSAISTLSPSTWFGGAYEAASRTVALDRLVTSTPQSQQSVDDGSILFEYDEDRLASPAIHPASSVTRSQLSENTTPAVSSRPAKLHETHESISSSFLKSSTPESKTSRFAVSDLTETTTKSKMSSPISADTPKNVHEAVHVLSHDTQGTRFASPEVIPENQGLRRVRFDRVHKTSTSTKISVASPRTSVSPLSSQNHTDKSETERTSISSRHNALSPTRKASHGEPTIVSQSESRLTSSSCVEQDEMEKSKSIQTSRKEQHEKISPLSQDVKISLDDPVTPMYVSPPWLPTVKVSPTENTCPRQSKVSKSDATHASSPMIVNSAIETMSAVMESKSEEESITTSAHDKSSKDLMCTPASVSDRAIVHDVQTQLTASDELYEEASFENTPCFKFASVRDTPLNITTHAKKSNLDTPSSIVSEVFGENRDTPLSNGDFETKTVQSAEPRRKREEVMSLPTRKDVVRALHARHRSSMRSSIENCTACSACIIV